MAWPGVRLGDLVDRLTNGYVGATKNIYVDGGVPYILARQIKNNTLKFDKRTYVSEEFNLKNKKSILIKGDVLLVQSGHIGHSAVVPAEHEGHNCHALIVITPKQELLGDYLTVYFSFLLLNGGISKIRSGSTVPHLTCKLVKELQIPLPPIPEQKRIVAILDKAFAEIDRVRALTEQNLKNARELFESYLQQVFSQRGEGWVETTLGNEIDLLTGFAFKSKHYVTHSDSTPLIRGDNIVQGRLRWDGVKLWANDNVDEYVKYQLQVEDVVIAMDRTWVKAGMKFSKITKKDLPALLVQRVARLRCKDSIKSDYLYHLVGSKLFENYVLSIQTGLGVPHISGKQIQSFRFTLPSKNQQEVIVSTLNKLASVVLELSEIYQKKLASIGELKKSILQKAFSGELEARECA